MFYRNLALFVFSILFFSSCVPTKRLTYLQDKGEAEDTFLLNRANYLVQPNDILRISVTSPDQETNEYFNLSAAAQGNAQIGDLLFFLQGFSVDIDGKINIPVCGEIIVQDKSIAEVRLIIMERLKAYFVAETFEVRVQLAGIQFSIIGEVNKPGSFVAYRNQVNILQALAMAGDITTVGDRKEVMIVRQGQNGQVVTLTIDLTDKNILSSPNYFLYPNDIINIRPLPQKSFGIGTTGFETFSQIFSVAVSTISLIFLINNFN
jgi:polysaccharide export outer membrane protein